MIKKVYITECGYCVNDLSKVYEGYRKEKVNFPANCVIIEHSTEGWILFDTGYSELIYKSGLIGRVYNVLNPTFIDEKDNIKNKLSKINVKCEDISYVVMSHFHPDHIGGLNYFNNAKIVTSKGNFEELKCSTIHSLIFKNMIPKNIEGRIDVVEDTHTRLKVSDYLEGYDLFDDGEIILVNLRGHSKGQLGMLLKRGNLFFVADSYWREDEINQDIKLKLIARMIQSSYNNYVNTQKYLKDYLASNTEIKLIASHEIVTDEEVQKYAREDFNIEKLH
ncbi:MAG TPA: hypothetical protein DEP72_04270 [Clostridiales bacterium]|nr:MAG: hypothetical protein A2Y18_04850 [Clostridiales bacterium GWD2_32_19]HCC07356.1 hypothetical protein [Clostridiales bacterium]